VASTHLYLARARNPRKTDWMIVMTSSCSGLPLAWDAGLGMQDGEELCVQQTDGGNPGRPRHGTRAPGPLHWRIFILNSPRLCF
jgi:hypothetical protein